ncbi:MAG: T9SS type A sorting domain-containing protein, partial [Bacteroidota bacterium]
ENTPALLDQLTGEIIEPGYDYAFTASFNDMEDRFVFATDLTSIQEKINALSVWEYNNTVFVKNADHRESNIKVYNLQGVNVYSSTGNRFNLDHLSPAMYIIKVKSGDSMKVEKIVIK